MSTIDPKAVWPGWETVRLIGRGSFGAVYEIQRDVFGETEKAALKLISIPQSESDISEMRSDGYDDESITSTFQAHLRSIVAEYSLMRKLNGSANVVNCDDVRYVQHKNGFGWDILIKMELLTPLTQALPAEIPEEQAVKIGKDLARALVQCRQFDIVHRDIKPQNIFVSPLGDYKLGDFGIAKTVEKTSGGTKIGTYKYMAPEVYNNQPYGAGADIYSLGLVLYWLLNERRMPFLPLPPAKLGAGMEEQARLRRFRGERIPAPLHGSEALKQIVLKCCAFDPKDRFANAEELLRALEKAEKNSEFGVRNSEDEREAPPAPVGAGLAPARKQEPDSPGGASPSPTPEDETVGVFGSAAVGAAISRPPVKEPAPDEEATVSAAMPVGADAPGGPKPTTDGNGLSRAPAPTPETTVPAEDATVGVFGAANPVGAAISRPAVKEPAPDEEATVSAVQRPMPQAPKQTQESKNTPAPAKKPETVQPKPEPQSDSPVTEKKSGGKGKLIGILAAILAVAAAVLVFLLLGKGGGSKTVGMNTNTISAGYGHTVAVRTDGTVVAVGSNEYGQCNVSDWHDIVSVSAGFFHTVGLCSDGTVVAAGINRAGECDVGDWTDIVAVSAGGAHTVGLRSDGTVVAVGDNGSGQCDVGDWRDIVEISAGASHTVGLRSDGTVVAVGANDASMGHTVNPDGTVDESPSVNGQCNVSEWRDIVSVSAAFTYTLGLRSDGTLVCTGMDNDYFALGVDYWHDIEAISAGTYFFACLRSDGTVVPRFSELGFQNYDPGEWQNIVAISTTQTHIVGLRSDGTVVAAGLNDWGQCDVSDWTNIAMPEKNS